MLGVLVIGNKSVAQDFSRTTDFSFMQSALVSLATSDER